MIDHDIQKKEAKSAISPAGEADSSDERQRIKLEPENVEKGLAQLVLTLIELLRRLMERQAVRRMENGELTEAQVEKMGETFLMLDKKIHELLDYFGLEEEDLNINLGPLGDLM